MTARTKERRLVLPTFVIGLREGLEAVLIVGIITAFLGQQGRKDAASPGWSWWWSPRALVMTAFHTANEAGWLSAGQTQAFDLSWLVRPSTPLSSLLTGVLGIQPHPVWIEVIAWLATRFGQVTIRRYRR